VLLPSSNVCCVIKVLTMGSYSKQQSLLFLLEFVFGLFDATLFSAHCYFLFRNIATQLKVCEMISLQLLSETFIILRIIQRGIIINGRRSLYKMTVIFVRF
jgi:hypothetical protein